jgi:superfamily II DNA or RNA helicase
LLPQMLREADALLTKARAVIPDAASCSATTAPTPARPRRLLRTIAGEKPVVVVSDEPQAHARIDRFARGDASVPRWLVAVNMVSEGVDVPRLALAAYATVKRTDLFFRQAVGRVVHPRAAAPPTPATSSDRLPARRPDADRLRRARRDRAAPTGPRRPRHLSTPNRRPGSRAASNRSTRTSSPAA